MPKDIRAIEQLWKDGWKRPEDGDGEVGHGFIAAEKQGSENKPDKEQNEKRDYPSWFGWGEFLRQRNAAGEKVPKEAGKDRFQNEKSVFLDGYITNDQTCDEIWIVGPDFRGNKIIIPGGGVHDCEKNMNSNRHPRGATVGKAARGKVVFVVPPSNGEKDENGQEEEAKEEAEVSHGIGVR